jgi:hypothetical protein
MSIREIRVNGLARSFRQNLAAAVRSLLSCPVAPAEGSRVLGLHRLSVVFAVVALAAAAVVLAACGRNGQPLPPPGPAVAQPPPAAAAAPPGAPAATSGGSAASGPTTQETAAQKNGFDLFGNPVAPPGQKKTFLLDPLLQ